jgi:hypothetical protein
VNNTERTRAVMCRLFGDVADGNVTGVLDTLSQDVVFEFLRAEHSAVLPDAGVWRGKEAVAEAFRRRAECVDVIDDGQRDVVADGERALVVTFQRIRHRATGAEASFERAALLTTDDDGLVRHWRVLSESADETAVFRSDLDARLLDAVRAGSPDEVTTLLWHGANPNHRDRATGLTTLQTAADLGDVTIVAALVAAGGDIHSTDSVGGATALHKAVQCGDLRTVRHLVDAGAFVDSVAPTTGHTPLHDAMWHGFQECARVLLAAGARTDLLGHDGRTPLDFALESFGSDHPLVLGLATAVG